MGGWQRIAAAFEAAYRRAPETVADAGGRVNLIGEHTDYHEGFVFPAAIDLRTRVAGAARPDGVLRVRSVNRGEETTVAIADLAPPSRVDWQAYVLGPFWALREAGHPIVGADIVVEGEVPFGGGLSSSASVEVALAALGAAMAGVDLPPAELARLARVAENGFCRVPCGAMDQVASACGRTDHALLLDCRTLVATPVPMPEDWRIVVADSGVRHAVAGPEYARRQHECAEGMAVLRDLFPDVVAARDLTMEMLTDHRDRLTDVSFRRLRHVVTENARCLAAQAALSRGD
ncbi:MAG TPA: galactokinase family protein, partial [Myxococcota bacterium]|nr:galactokinase family protein [Myxococcota bacterium]